MLSADTSDQMPVTYVARLDSANVRATAWIKVSWVLLATAFFWHGWLVSRGIDDPLLDGHSWRQTQTALSTKMMAEHGMSVDYETPVFGPPWKAPFEFPTFEWCVAQTHLATGWPLDFTGRVVALAFFYLLLIPVAFMLRFYRLTWWQVRLALCFVLVSPVYLFWSRAFLIESAALFITLVFAASSLWYQRKPSLSLLGLALVFGVLAGITKITTFCLAVGLVSLTYAWQWLIEPKQKRLSSLLKIGLPLAVIILASLISGVLWTKHTDVLKDQNPFAHEVTSHELSSFNFGTVAQRISPKYIARYAHFGLSNALYWIPSRDSVVLSIARSAVTTIVLAALFLLAKRRRWAALPLLAAYMAGPIVFANLYERHDYYWYANSIYLLIAAAVLWAWCWNESRDGSKRRRYLSIGSGVGLALCAFGYLGHPYFMAQKNPPEMHFLEIAKAVRDAVPEGGVVEVCGYNWHPAIAYYSGRQAVMVTNPDEQSLTDFKQVLTKIHGEGHEVGAVVTYVADDQPIQRWNKFVYLYPTVKDSKQITEHFYMAVPKDDVTKKW